MLEEVGQNPAVFFLGCLVWFPVAVWVLSLLQWMIQGDVEAWIGFPGILLAISLGVLTTWPPDPMLSPLLFTAVLGTVVLFPFVRNVMRNRAFAQFEYEQMETVHETLRMRPDNAASKFRLAEMLYKRGYVGQAIAMADEVLPQMPPHLFAAEHRVVNQWRHGMHDPAAMQIPKCPHCGHVSAPSSHLCDRCRRPFLLALVRSRWMGRGVALRMMGGWMVALLLLVGIPATVKAPGLPVLWQVVLIVAQVSLGIFVMIRTFVRLDGSST